MAQQIQLRRDLKVNWEYYNPVLAQGEIGLELDSSPIKIKVGNGTTAWIGLPYATTLDHDDLNNVGNNSHSQIDAKLLTLIDEAEKGQPNGIATLDLNGDVPITQLTLAQTQIDNLSDQIESLADGSPKGVYANLSALQAAHPSGDTGIYVTQDSGKWYWWTNGLWTEGGQYQAALSVVQTTGSSTTNVMSQKAVSDEVLKSIPVNRPTKNFYNDSAKESGKYINTSTGEILSGGDNTISEYINVSEGETFIMSGLPSSNFTINKNTFWAGFYNSSKSHVGVVVSEIRKPITAPSGALYMVVQVAYGVASPITSGIMIERQSTVTEFSGYLLNEFCESIGDTSVNGIYTKYIPSSKNIFSKQAVNQGVQGTNPPYSFTIGDINKYTSGFIEVDDSKEYVYRALKTNYSSSIFVSLVQYDSSYSATSGNSGTRLYTPGYDDYYVYRYKFAAGTKYVVIQVAYGGTTQDFDSVQFEEGYVPTTYDSFSSKKAILSIAGVATEESSLSIPIEEEVLYNKINKDDILMGILSTANPGQIVASSTSAYTNYIEMTPLTWYSLKFKTNNLSINKDGWINFYDNNKTFLQKYSPEGYWVVDGDYTIVYFRPPTGSSYALIQLSYTNHATADYSTISLFEGIGNFNYIPYSNYATSVNGSSISSFPAYYFKNNNQYYGKKAVFLGDSISYQNLWQPLIQNYTGIIYSVNELKNGVSPYRPTAVGGSMVTPLITGLTGQTAGDSIYYRADHVQYYTPDYIFILGGQNDSITAIGGTIPIGTPSDTAYSGAEVVSNPPSFCASYKGMLEKLITQNKNATIICLTPLPSLDQSYTNKKLKSDAIIECAKLYGAKIINLFEQSGINSITFSNDLADGVHPNSIGAEKMKRLILSNL